MKTLAIQQFNNLRNTPKAFSTCSGAIVLLSSLLQTSLDSDETRFINSTMIQINQQNHVQSEGQTTNRKWKQTAELNPTQNIHCMPIHTIVIHKQTLWWFKYKNKRITKKNLPENTLLTFHSTSFTA